jgi:hypothetical protein
MSKVVRGVGRAIGKVVDGVKKFAKSKVGKVIIAAAAMYFGVPMISGAIGGATAGAAAGSGFMGTLSGAISGGLSGAAAGISQAWAGLTGAATALGSGSISGAGEALYGGISPTSAFTAGGNSLAPAAGALPVQQGSMMANGLPAGISPDAPAVGNYIENFGRSVTGGAPGGASGSGIIGRAWESLGPYGKFGVVQAGSQLVGSVMQGVGAQKQYEQQRQVIAEDRERYNRNVGAPLYSY